MIQYPEQWNKLSQAVSANRLPHALLLKNMLGEFAISFSKALLCSSEGLTACDNCHACNLFNARTHPDFFMIEPEEGKKNIRIDQVRSVINDLTGTAQLSGYRIVIVNPADSMNVASANAFLKTLEEPGDKTLLILITTHPHRLPATIRSRCQTMLFPSLDAETASLDSAVLTSMSEIAKGRLDPVAYSTQILDDAAEVIDGWLAWIAELIRKNMGVTTPSSPCATTPSSRGLTAGSTSLEIPLKNLYRFSDELCKVRQLFLFNSSINRQLVLESLLCQWAKLGAK